MVCRQHEKMLHNNCKHVDNAKPDKLPNGKMN